MNCRRTPLTRICKSRVCRCVRTFLTLIVLSTLALQGLGGSVLLSTLARMESEESSEESKCEVEIRELSHKCSRWRFAGPGKHGVVQAGAFRTESMRRVPRPSAPRFFAHLVGAGIGLRC